MSTVLIYKSLLDLGTTLQMSALEQLRLATTVVVDTGDFRTIEKYRPKDSTTNPSLILAAVNAGGYSDLVDSAIEYALSRDKRAETAVDRLIVEFGISILKIIPGRVSTEVDASLSYDTESTVRKARRLLELYEEAGIDSSRILIKIAATWEGIEAVQLLEKEGVHCNVTLLFSTLQAAKAANARATLISPFVGRISDWHQKHGRIEEGVDPGVDSVKKIYRYIKSNNFQTQVMGASFRNIEQILALAGIDLLTISPKLLSELDQSKKPVNQRAIHEGFIGDCNIQDGQHSKKSYYELLNGDLMAFELLADGIKRFEEDGMHLKNLLINLSGEKLS